MNSKQIQLGLYLLVLISLIQLTLIHAQSAPLLPQENGQQLAAAFEQVTLSAEQLAVFELRSQQLIREFIDYYELLRTQTGDEELQLILREELEQLLFDSNASLHLNGFENAYPLASLPLETAPTLRIQDIRLLEQGQIDPTLPWQYRLSLSVQGNPQNARVTTVLFRQLKTFGNIEKEVWKVALLDWQVE